MTKGSHEIIVHKEGDEGTLTIDAVTGRITTVTDQQPDWADGLAVAQLAEREGYYRNRLGDKAAKFLLEPDAIAFQDLSWIGVDEEGDECELEADSDYRMDVVARTLGINREDYDSDEQFGKVLAEAELEMQPQPGVSPAQAAAMDEGMKETFGIADSEAEQDKKSGSGS